MNRIRPLPIMDESQAQSTMLKTAENARRPAITAPCHAFFSPLHYEPNYAYPLVVWLHGPHDNENQLKKIVPLVSLRNYVAVAARGTAVSELDGGRGYCFNWRQADDHIAAAEARVLDSILAAEQKFNIAPSRIFVAGLESGGTMALRLAVRNPERFAGALSFGGPFPTDRAPLSRLSTVRRLPLFLATTQASELYPEELVCEQLRLFHSAGMVVTLRQYPGDDGLTTLMLSDMDRWIMEQVTQTPSVQDEVGSGRLTN